jgi:hypothetical protein
MFGLKRPFKVFLMPSSETISVALATTPNNAVFVIGAPNMLIAISVAGTVQILPFETFSSCFKTAGSTLELIINISSS